MSQLFQWEQHGPFRPMTPDGTRPDGDCQELPEGQPVLMGNGITDNAGNWSLTLRPAMCVGLYIIDGVSIVATPTVRQEPNVALVVRPVIVTTSWTALGGNLTLHVRSWDLHGQPAPEVPFSWHATVFHHLD
jgi:hypothetical protein